jgi:hypothetical protein
MTKPKKPLTDLEMIESVINLCKKAIKKRKQNPSEK